MKHERSNLMTDIDMMIPLVPYLSESTQLRHSLLAIHLLVYASESESESAGSVEAH